MVNIQLARHYFVSTDNYWLEGYIYDQNALVVTFEHAGGERPRPDSLRTGWSSHFFRKRRVSHLCVKPAFIDWYQHRDLADAIIALRNRGFFLSFEKVVTYGASMGGFGALAYADLIGAQTVVALNPQSTQNRKIAPWDTRFPVSQQTPMDGPYADAVGKYRKAKDVIIVGDRHDHEDGLHMKRLAAPNVRILNTPFMGHGVAAYLNGMGLLAAIIMQPLRWGRDDGMLFEGLRKRRNFPHYYDNMLRHDRVKNSPRFTDIVTRAKMQNTGK
ncbi:hypothetical protein D2T29_14040 [Sinirhodobacter populi]|uniref:Alpha/beta hydrolase n=1 Tax=Paenirhodobacter populi TaxID=2306993 RepID=A0A443K9U0_9RHOB|nr:hypothetical protein [Sinirhodobacter populi]RWR29538.1 hypothetical protein D2T29_14040 [Sinirhodobacter populi]